MDAVEQMFPLKQGGSVMHKRWAVDVDTAALLGGIPVERMLQEAREMANHFPRWLLTVTRHRELIRCPACDGMLVFDRGLRCVQCDERPRRAISGARPGWFGVMPPIGIDGLQGIKTPLMAQPPRQHVVGFREGLGNFVLVPLVATYPSDFPAQAPHIFYLPEFKDIPGIPRDEFSHEFHMIGNGRMCLFAAHEWYPQMTCREVLQQRAYPHVIKFLNYANGKKHAFAKVS